ncbi:MAG TPA: class E sortase [Acidimicrobiales bacterium]|nr:class E sortase [Acidimicrobiales bacterium]
MDWRRAMAGTGRVLIASGVLILLFVAYQLWGTGLAEARSQRSLKNEFAALLRRTAPPTAPGTPPAEPPPAPPPAPTGSAVAMIRIPEIGVEKAVVEGVSLADLKKGPGHYPETPMPGQPGNAAVAGHRTTYGAPFYDLDELEAGDPILVTTGQGSFRYEVTEKKVVKPSEVSVLDQTPDNRLTLTTCHPRFSARERLVVVAALKGEAAPAPPPGTPAPPADGSTPTTLPTEELDQPGLSGESASNWPTVLWGLLAAAVWFGAWLLARRWRPWPAYALGAPVFLVVLFVFFENVSRVLPANF